MRGIATSARVAFTGGPLDPAAAAFREQLRAALDAAGITVGDTIDEATDAALAFDGLTTPAPDALVAPYLGALASAQRLAHVRGERSGAFVAFTNLGGTFGHDGAAGDRAWMGGFAGMAKTAAREWTNLAAAAIDLPVDLAPADALAARVAAELLRPESPVEVGFASEERRLVLREVERPAVRGLRPRLPDRPVIVATGGGRGIVAASLEALARTGIAPRIAILGRTSLAAENGTLTVAAGDLPRYLVERAKSEGQVLAPLQLRAAVGRIAAGREVRATLAALESAGADVTYQACDAADAGAVHAALAATRARFGGIDAIVHGAGVLADRRITEQTPEQFTTVFRTKVDAFRALLDGTRDDTLAAIVVFSSVAARYGNVGQVAYAAANEVLNKVARAEAARRGPACLVRALNWGPWDGGMVTGAVREAFAARGVPVIPLAAGARAFVDEFWSDPARSSAVDVDVVLAQGRG